MQLCWTHTSNRAGTLTAMKFQRRKSSWENLCGRGRTWARKDVNRQKQEITTQIEVWTKGVQWLAGPVCRGIPSILDKMTWLAVHSKVRETLITTYPAATGIPTTVTDTSLICLQFLYPLQSSHQRKFLDETQVFFLSFSLSWWDLGYVTPACRASVTLAKWEGGGAPGQLSRLSIWLELRSWSHNLWVRAPRQALYWQLRAWSLLQIPCLPLSFCPFPACACVLSLSKINK